MQLFDESESIWDARRDRPLPEDEMPEMDEVDRLDVLAISLRQAKWRPASRALYNGYFRAWASFAIVNDCAIMPAGQEWLTRWLVWMALHYAAATVGTAAAGVVVAVFGQCQ